MKVLILCFPILALCAQGFCKETTLSRSWPCREYRTAQIDQKCYQKGGNTGEALIQQFNETVYTNGNASSVQLWATQVCEFAKNVVGCLVEGYKKVKPECQNNSLIVQNGIAAVMARESISFLCEDNGKTLVDISENNGYQCLFYTKRYNDCIEVLGKESPGINTADEFVLNSNFCRSFNRAKECFVEKSKDCLNQKIETIVAGVFSYAGGVMCDP